MHKLLDGYLSKKYPKILAQRNLPMTQTCMCWGFEHNNGWFYLIDNLCFLIQHYVDNPPYQIDNSFKSKIKKLWIPVNRRIWNYIVYPLASYYFTPKDTKSYKWKIYNKLQKWFDCNIPYNEAPGSISQVEFLQVKEKFGTLRIYFQGGDDYIRGLVCMAESLSGNICEDCGKMDHTIGSTKGWIKTCCKKHCNNPLAWQNNNDEDLQKTWKQIEKEKNESKKD